MTGKPGMRGNSLGGKRAGAGRPPRKITVRVGQDFLLGSVVPGQSPDRLEMVHVVEITRDTIVLETAAGRRYSLRRGS